MFWWRKPTTSNPCKQWKWSNESLMGFNWKITIAFDHHRQQCKSLNGALRQCILILLQGRYQFPQGRLAKCCLRESCNCLVGDKSVDNSGMLLFAVYTYNVSAACFRAFSYWDVCKSWCYWKTGTPLFWRYAVTVMKGINEIMAMRVVPCR